MAGMDVVTHYSPSHALLSPIHGTSYQSSQKAKREQRASTRSSLPLGRTSATKTTNSHHETTASTSTNRTAQKGAKVRPRVPQQHATSSTTFNRAVEINLNEPVGSMSLSPANRDVVLAARKGLFILDLENPYDQPRFLPHLTTWVPADVQWNPHPARANWVASTSNNKLLVWNLDRPAAHRLEPVFSAHSASGTNTGSSATSLMNLGTTPLMNLTGTLPHTPPFFDTTDATISRSSSISHVLNAHTRAITDINWSPFHPEILASCGIDAWMWAWDLREPSRPKQGYSAWNAAMTQVKWNRASPHRLATSCDNKVLIWDDRKGALPLATIEAAQSRVYGIDWSRDTSLGLSRLVTCSLDGSVKWWDLDSPAAQQAIGERQLITEAETTIETHTPVWRARHLPFGNGVMTLPQRGDTSLGMWAKDQPDKPVHRFEGHRDTVKEYLIRTQGGSDRERDDRKFQLITWSKDQTLRLWPISEDMMKAVGHQRNTPIRVMQTRIGAENVSYRVPPEPLPGLIATTSLAGRGAALDAVGWIAGVRMGDEEKGVSVSPATQSSAHKGGEGNTANVADDGEAPRDAAQILGEEIKAVSRNVSEASFEKIDVSTRQCTLTCYGPWAGRSVACFLRITFTFPPTYPSKAPKFDLEHNASVSLKTRAFLLRKVSSILNEATQKLPPEPSMGACLRFLHGETLEEEVQGGSSGLHDLWLPGDESEEEEERSPRLKMAPRRSGASFGPGGVLVTFSPSNLKVDSGRSDGMEAEISSTPGGASTATGGEGTSVAGARFLQSYTALSGAMNSLSRLAKGGMAVQDLDVVQLMADQNFLAKRLAQQQSRGGSQASSVARQSASKARDKDRLGYIRSSLSRPALGSRTGRKARSASPMPKDQNITAGLQRSAGPSAATSRITTTTIEKHSQVRLWNVRSLLFSLTSTPEFVRKRSNSMPTTPTSLNPRTEQTLQISSLAVPTSLQQSRATQRRPNGRSAGASIARGRGRYSGVSIPRGRVQSSDTDSDDSDDRYGDSDSDEEPDASALLRSSQRNAMNPVVEQILDTIIWTTPFGFLYLMMDVMIQQQYGIAPTFLGEVRRMANALPILTVFVYSTAIRPTSNRTFLQLLLFLVSSACGTSFLYIYARSTMEIVVRRVPPLGTLWMYSLVRLDLSLVLLSLSIIWAFVTYHDLPVLS